MASGQAVIETNEASRVFMMNGVRVPSVTDLMPPPTFYCTDEQLEAARLDGVANHALVESYWDYGGDTFDVPYLIEYDRFIKAHPELGPMISYEKRYFSKRGFCGKPDTVFQNGIVDLKRTITNPLYHAIQTAGYNVLTKEAGIHTKQVKWYVLQIDEHYTEKAVNNRHAEAIFLSLLERYWIDNAIAAYLKQI